MYLRHFVFVLIAAINSVPRKIFASDITDMITIAVQGKSDSYFNWLDVISQMKTKHRIKIFLLSYDAPISEAICKSSDLIADCNYLPKSSWTVGRNELERSVSRFEHKSRKSTQFKYVLMADQDFVNVSCFSATGCNSSSSTYTSACCFDVALRFLLDSKLQYSEIGAMYVPYWTKRHMESVAVAHVQNNDAAWIAYHRESRQILFPYVNLLDNITWPESIHLQWHLAAACMPGKSLYLHLFTNLTNEHAPYARRRYSKQGYHTKAMERVYGSRGLIPYPVSSSKKFWHQRGSDEVMNTTLLPMLEFMKSLNSKPLSWTKTATYIKCKSAMKRRYDAYQLSGDLQAIDGEYISP